MKKEGIPLKRKVLTEKIKNSSLFIYTLINVDKKIKNPFFGISKQLQEGIEISRQEGLEPIEYNESWLMYKPEQIVGRCMLSLLSLVIKNRAKFIYVRKIEMLSRSKKLRNYILYLFSVYGVTLYTKKRRYPLEELITTPEILFQLDILIDMVNEIIITPYQFVKN